MQQGARYDVDLMLRDAAAVGWLPIDLIRAASVSIAHGYRFFRRESQTPRTAKKLADALGCPVDRYLLGARPPRPARRDDEDQLTLPLRRATDKIGA